MPEVVHEKPTPEAVEWISQNLRRSDLDELRAYGVYGTFEDQLRAHVVDFGSTAGAMVAHVEDEPAVLYGLKPPSAAEAAAGYGWSPWLLATKRIESIPLTLHREAVRIVDRWRAEVMLMDNFIWEKNEAGRAWLTRLGFYWDPKPYRFKPRGAVFRRFMWRDITCARLSSPRLR